MYKCPAGIYFKKPIWLISGFLIAAVPLAERVIRKTMHGKLHISIKLSKVTISKQACQNKIDRVFVTFRCISKTNHKIMKRVVKSYAN